MERLIPYLPGLATESLEKFRQLEMLVQEWNGKLNLVSRNDLVHLRERHLLHSLTIARYFPFPAGTRIIDIGCGGGFPGLPLAIAFPSSYFTLVDSVGKKIRAVEDMASRLDLKNVRTLAVRAETLDESFHFITGRAVTAFPRFVSLFRHLVEPAGQTVPENGIIYLKGGALENEMGKYRNRAIVYDLSKDINTPFFETKKIIYLPVSSF